MADQQWTWIHWEFPQLDIASSGWYTLPIDASIIALAGQTVNADWGQLTTARTRTSIIETMSRHDHSYDQYLYMNPDHWGADKYTVYIGKV